MKDTTCWCKPPYDNICASCRWLERNCEECEQPHEHCTCQEKDNTDD